MNYRNLNKKEVEILIANNNQCSNWESIEVIDQFTPDKIKNCQFSGNNRLGYYTNEVQFYGGVSKPCGLYNSHFHNCTLGNNLFINNVKDYIANYQIEDDVIIDNIDYCAVDGTSSFGNGIMISVLDETGGRKVPMFDSLSAHLAYIMAFYKHEQKAINQLEKMIANYSSEIQSSKGKIGNKCRITNCRIIRDVNIGEHALLDGCSKLQNGSINSTESAPVKIGHNVNMHNFIISSGSSIANGSLIENCFIGQGCSIGSQYSAENSLFFANCQGFHGEACALFAGPYTVTHHKSTLLIAGMFSFSNAGSGSNQSNHMYKLGPIHHGIVERGAKTTSDSYLLWPAKIGAFTMVMGRHYKNCDTSELPFSYLIESKDDSWLVPAINLRSVGTIRDAIKWPQRDKRTDIKQNDYINFNLLSPFTIQKNGKRD